MKRVLQIILPIAMAVAILFSIGWYFLEYDTDLTRDILLKQARHYEENGNYRAAVWFYELAYRQSNHDAQVAIELAEQFKSNGNYSKAESTLTKAIADGGNVDLYVALCKTYVEQNKLLDAVQMLDKVHNNEIKAQLDALRPAPPAASAPSGTYNQYLSVSLHSDAAHLYYAMDGEYPSTSQDAYTGPITLSGGNSTIFVIAVNEDGLVSKPVTYTYTVERVVEEVVFADNAIAAAVRQLLGLAENSKVFSNQLWDVKSFTVPSSAVSCEDLVWLPNLTEIVISNAAFDSLETLAQLTKLETVLIVDSVISSADVRAIASLPKLGALAMRGCSLSTIDGLANATNLWYLDIRDNTIRNISVLSNMKKLQSLYISNNAIVGLESISGLTELMILDASSNAIVSTAPLSGLHKLTKLDISSNGLMMLEGMEKLTELVEFSASNNKFVEVDALASCTKLQKLDISNNHLLDIDVVTGLTKLQELNFSHNEVTNLPTFKSGCPMTVINGAYNQLSSLDNLAKLTKLEYIYMDYNLSVKSVNALTKCTALKVVNVYGTKVTSVKKLTDMGVIVNYSPL